MNRQSPNIAKPRTATITLTHDDYTVAWICALPKEEYAARNMLDEHHQSPPQPTHDKNIYTFGSMCGHNVVIVCQGEMGTTSTAVVATRMEGTFRNLRFGLLVGIAGGVPDNYDVRLGDVVICKGDGLLGGVVTHDRGTYSNDGFVSKSYLNGVPEVLMNAFSKMESLHKDQDPKIRYYLDEAASRNPRFSEVTRPVLVDRLFDKDYDHVDRHAGNCKECDEKYIITRIPRNQKTHFGIIASGNQVIKNARKRAEIAARYPGLLAIEMEAAGLMNVFGCATIRGICDYADSHKNDDWQDYSAAIAAATAKEVLEIIPVANSAVVESYDNIPYHKQVSFFVGRNDVLQELENRCTPSPEPASRPSVTVLQALGGQGKTQVAMELARRCQDKFRGMFWVNATSKTSTDRSFKAISTTIKGDQLIDEDFDVKSVMQLLQGWKDSWLLIFDNYDDPDTSSNFDIREYFPSKGRGVIFITSRHEATKQLTTSPLVKLQPMSDQDGAKLLLRFRNQDDQENAYQISKRLGGLPLAIDQAAAYIDHYELDLPSFMEQYANKKKQLILQYTPKNLWQYQGVEQTYKEVNLNAFTTWEMSFEKVCINDPQKKERLVRFLTICGFLNPSIISECIFTHYVWDLLQDDNSSWFRLFLSSDDGVSDDEISDDEGSFDVDFSDETTLGGESSDNECSEVTDIDGHKQKESLAIRHQQSYNKPRLSWNSIAYWNTLKELEELSLIQNSKSIIDKHMSTMTIHPLICDWLQLRTKSKDRPSFIKEVAKILVDFLDYLNKHPTNDHQLKYELLTHIDACINNDEQFCKHNSRLEYHNWSGAGRVFAGFYETQGQWIRASKLWRHISDRLEAELGPEHAYTLSSQNRLSMVLRGQGIYSEAEDIIRQVLKQREKVLSKIHPDILKTMNDLGLVLMDNGKYEECESIHRQTLELRAMVLGEQHPDTLSSMQNLAMVIEYQGKYKDAEILHRQALAIEEILLGQEHINTLRSMDCLNVSMMRQGRDKEAEPLCRQVFEIKQKVLGQEHPETLSSFSNLAGAILAQGKYVQAEKVYREGYKVSEKVLGPEHPNTLLWLTNITAAISRQAREGKLQETERLEEAERLSRYVLQVTEKVLGPEHPQTLGMMNNLAAQLMLLGRLKEVDSLSREVLRLAEKVLGSEHPHTLIAMHKVAEILADQGSFEEAEKIHRRVLELRIKVLGEEHQQTFLSINRLASLLKTVGRYDEATGLQQRAVSGLEKLLGDEHPVTIKCRQEYQEMLETQGLSFQKEKNRLNPPEIESSCKVDAHKIDRNELGRVHVPDMHNPENFADDSQDTELYDKSIFPSIELSLKTPHQSPPPKPQKPVYLSSPQRSALPMKPLKPTHLRGNSL